jgi:hypothetical protein
MTLKCVAPMMIWLPPGVNSATLPLKRRADALPFGVINTRHGEMAAPVTVNISTHLATIDQSGVNAAEITGSRIGYYPQFEVIALRPTQQADVNGAIFGWELICEEI